jgi:hypothetical protein
VALGCNPSVNLQEHQAEVTMVAANPYKSASKE